MFGKFLLGHKLNIQLMPRESPCPGSSSSPVAWTLTVMLSCLWEEGFFSASLSFRMPLPSRSPFFQTMPHFATVSDAFPLASPLPLPV